MTTQLIGLKQFRANISTLWKTAKKKQVRYIVMYHTQPIFEVNPLTDEDSLTALANTISTARKQAKQGKVYSQTAVRKMLGL